MSSRNSKFDSLCPVARANSKIGDRWTLVIIRELFMNTTRFDEIQAQTGATPQMLATRLRRMEADGLVKKRGYSKRPLRYEYLLTRMGKELFPIIMELRSWAERWLKEKTEPLAMHMHHRGCGGEVELDGICKLCKADVPAKELLGQPSAQYARERARRNFDHLTAGRPTVK